MPHRWSPLKLAARREAAVARGFISSRPCGFNFVSVASSLALRVKRMAAGLAAVQQLELVSGFHRRSANDLLSAAKDLVPNEVAASFSEVNDAANAAKHASFLRSSRRGSARKAATGF